MQLSLERSCKAETEQNNPSVLLPSCMYIARLKEQALDSGRNEKKVLGAYGELKVDWLLGTSSESLSSAALGTLQMFQSLLWLVDWMNHF